MILQGKKWANGQKNRHTRGKYLVPDWPFVFANDSGVDLVFVAGRPGGIEPHLRVSVTAGPLPKFPASLGALSVGPRSVCTGTILHVGL